jgi:hypothetical protein
MRFLLVFLILIWAEESIAQFSFYYQFKKVHGVLYSENGDQVSVRIRSRNRIEIEGGSCDELKFLKTLMIHRHGRKELEHLLTTSSKITLIISDKVGVRLEGKKYRLIAGIAGPQEQQSNSLILETKKETRNPRFVFERNTVEIFKGSVEYAWNRDMAVDTSNVKLFVLDQHEPVTNFSMDTISIERLAHPELMYRNLFELFYFAGIHEIYHTRDENINLAIYGEDAETSAYTLERKAFRKRKWLNRRFKKRL